MGLSQPIDPMDCLQQQQVFEGELGCGELPRLSEVLCEASDERIAYEIRFRTDGHGRCILDCKITACLNVVCQRCGGPMELPIAATSALCVVASDDEAKRIPKQYEPLVLDEGMVCLRDVIEDELLLAIPMIPRHDQLECPANLSNDLIN